MTKTELKQLIKECIEEVAIEEGNLLSGFLGGVAGYILGSVQKNVSNEAAQDEKLRQSAVNYESAVKEMDAALAPYEGTTSEEKIVSLANDLGKVNVSSLILYRNKKKKKKM
jgi:hypothetical protein